MPSLSDSGIRCPAAGTGGVIAGCLLPVACCLLLFALPPPAQPRRQLPPPRRPLRIPSRLEHFGIRFQHRGDSFILLRRADQARQRRGVDDVDEARRQTEKLTIRLLCGLLGLVELPGAPEAQDAPRELGQPLCHSQDVVFLKGHLPSIHATTPQLTCAGHPGKVRAVTAPRLQRSAAFYDVDGTLIRANIVHAFAYYAANQPTILGSLFKTVKTVASLPLFWAADKVS